MRCWQCGTVFDVSAPDGEPVHVTCAKCGKDLGLYQPRPKPVVAAMPAVTLPTMSALNALDAAPNRHVVDGEGYFGSVCILAIGLVLLAIGGVYLWQTDQILKTFDRAEGQLVQQEWQGTGRSRGIYGTAEFVAADGNTYAVDVGTAWFMKTGQRVHVYYNPENPQENRDGSFTSLYGFASAAGGLGLIVFIAGCFGVYRKSIDIANWQAQRARDLAEHGSRFPHVCARCARGEPAGTCRVCGPTTTVQGPAATVHTTPFVEVPICSKCQRTIYAIHAVYWIAGIVVGVSVAGVVLSLDGDFKTLAAGAALGGVLSFAFTAGIGQLCVSSLVSLGKLDPTQNTVTFKNAEYQRIYDGHLAKSVGPISTQNRPVLNLTPRI